MAYWSLPDCSWLPEPPEDFRERCLTLQNSAADPSAQLQRLAGLRLNPSQQNLLAATFAALKEKPQPLQGLTPFSLGLVSSATTGHMTPALTAAALRYGIALTVVEAGFGQVMQEALDPDSKINSAELDAVLLALDYRGVPFPDPLQGRDTEYPAAPLLDDEAEEFINLLTEKFGVNGKRTVIIQTIPAPPESLFGSYEYRMAEAALRQTELFNGYIADLPEESGVALLDVAALANRVGLDSWHDPVQWNLAKLPFYQKLLPLYSDHVARLVGAIRGKSRKCLVLDLDNTLWGGDGRYGIVLGRGNAVGEAYLSIQETALNLRRRGVILAVCSKNDEDNARLPFRQHPEMVLREEHIAVFKANWNDKASNLEEIAATLNIGLDALVLLDDNPAERAQVREALPQVAVPELQGNPAFFTRALLAGGYFEAIGYTRDDRQRADQYRANSQRASLQSSSRNLDEFLESLNMAAEFAPFDQVGRSRIVQLINKTNQFNLTTRRYTESQVMEMEADPEIFTMQVRLKDRFGDNGMISVVICKTEGKNWNLDLWLMSCRVLKRRLEELVLAQIVNAASEHGVETLIGSWIPSGRNGLVEKHYADLGFEFLRKENDATYWQLRLVDYVPSNPPITVTAP